jgi:hypothetical protein
MRVLQSTLASVLDDVTVKSCEMRYMATAGLVM